MRRFISYINRNIDTEMVGIEYNYGKLKNKCVLVLSQE